MNEEYYINLIYQSLDGDLSPSEKEELDQWRKASPNNEKSYQSVLLAWTHAEPQVDMPEINLDAEFASLSEKLIDEDEVTEEEDKVISINRPERRKAGFNWLAIAASIVLLFGITLVYQQLNSDDLEWIEVASGNESMSIILADNSEVILNAHSTFKYPKEFGEDERKLFLEGEAFFEVSRDENKPFIIETSEERVQVLGTSFNVRAYANEDDSQVFVKTGKVQFGSINGDKVVLNPNQLGSFDRNNKEITKREKVQANAISWMTKELVFVDEPFALVSEEIEHLYGVELDISEVADCALPYTSSFKDKDLSEVIENISVVLGLEYEQVSEKYYKLRGGQCD